ncbi:restriction endonuclease subunit S [[Haemophilus] felis]|uniref:Type I restriction modification DNA specificity domain-containing protein n=1 Tax=[Haemophilus] felis TaxID=123822 RepID=A0A1T0AVH5_9PAST|nr:restriction endonuclease subunit S [[Haemophilus] felis]OOS01015.1 hypothetical protein B0188_10335 [[Haemophilus] felis]
MEKYTIGNACNITTGKLDANQAKLNGKYPFFTCAEFPDYIDEYAFDDDVVLIAGNNARGNFHVNRYSGKFNAYQRTYVLTAKENFDLDFIYYSLKLELKRLKERSQGSQTKFLTIPILKSIKLKELDLQTQQKIAQVLSALDRKIALNQQINTELEKMAKTLYDYWFVQFDFPNENGNPYKSSGGEMVYNPELKREVPKGWEYGNIMEIANLLGGGTPSKNSDEFWNGHIPFFTPTDCNNDVYILSTKDNITKKGLEKSSTKLFPENTILLTARGTVGKLSLNAIPMAMNQSCYALIPKNDISYSFLYFLARQLIHILEIKATGSVFNSIVSNDIETTYLAIPQKIKIQAFGKICEPIFENIKSNVKQTQKLTQLRDFLLPMLMNGQVEVE